MNASPAPRPMLPAESLRPLGQVMAHAGLDAQRILQPLGLDPALLEDGADRAVPLSDYFRILEQMALQSGDETYHVSLRPLMVGTSEFVRARLDECGTMAEVMEVVANGYNVVHGHRYNLVRRRPGGLSYVIDDREFPYALDHDDPFVLLSLECLLIYVHVLLIALAADGTALPLASLRTRSPACPRGANHLSFWGAPVRHRAPVFSLDYPPEVGDIPVAADRLPGLRARTLYGSVAAILDRIDPPGSDALPLIDRVRREMAAGQFDQAEIARQLGMSVATLRRHLGEAGVSFRTLRAEMLNRVAVEKVAQGNSVAAVAELLGFSEGRSFARAFRQWNGVSPSDWRRQARESA